MWWPSGTAGRLFPGALLEPDGTDSKVWIDQPPEAERRMNYIWEVVSAFPGLKGAPRAWDTHSAKVHTSSKEVEQSRYDGSFQPI